MKIYKDKAQETAIVVCTIEELMKMETAFCFGAERFRKNAEEEYKIQGEEWKAELDMRIAIEYARIHDEIATATREEREAEMEEIRQEVLRRKNEETTEE